MFESEQSSVTLGQYDFRNETEQPDTEGTYISFLSDVPCRYRGAGSSVSGRVLQRIPCTSEASSD